MGNELKNIKFKYVFDDKYSPNYISGAIGGITPRQEVVLNFFFERQPIPYSETNKINEDGSVGAKIASKPKINPEQIDFIRNIENGVVMNLNTAKEVRKFLDMQITILENEQLKRIKK